MGKKAPIPDRLTVVYQRAIIDHTEALLMAPYPHWYTQVKQLPLPERLTYCVLIFDAQVGNGGLPQYFGNSYGQFAYETVAYLSLLGATAQAGILPYPAGGGRNRASPAKGKNTYPYPRGPE
jgi:hypothetical protein